MGLGAGEEEFGRNIFKEHFLIVFPKTYYLNLLEPRTEWEDRTLSKEKLKFKQIYFEEKEDV